MSDNPEKGENKSKNELDDLAKSLNLMNTKLIQREKELIEKEQRYKALIESSNTGAWEFNSETNFLWCSKEYFTMLGRNEVDYDLSGNDNLKKTWIDLVHPDDREKAVKQFSNYLEGGSVGIYENTFRMRHKEGHWVWIWSRARTLRGENNSIKSKTIGTHIDISKQKKIEESQKQLIQEVEERMKELNCLYEIYKISDDENISIADLLNKIVNIMPPSWQYPEITCAKISFLNQNYLSDNFTTSDWCQKEDILINGEVSGSIEVYYTEERPASDLGPFMKEEQHLIEAIAIQIANFYIKHTAVNGLLKSKEELEEKVEERTAELRESQSQFTSMVSNVPGVIYRCLLDEAWTMMFISDEIQNLSGYPANHFLNNSKRTFADIMHLDDIKWTSEYINETLKKGETFRVDYRILTSKGEVKWVRGQGQAVPSKGSEIKYLDGVIFDITEQKIAEMEIANADEKVRLILESAGEGIVGVDSTGITTFVNSAALRMLGYSQDEIIGKGIHDLIHSKFPDGSNYPIEDCAMYKTYTQSSTNHVDTEVLWRKNGSSFPVDYTSKPIIKDGKCLGAVITFSDITKRIESEKKILLAKETSDLIIEESPIPMIITSFEGEILKANRASLRFMQLSSFDELRKFNIVEVYTQPEQREEMLKRLNQSSIKNFEIEIRQLGTGNLRLVLSSSSEINYLNKRCLLSSIMDITDIKMYEEQLNQAKNEAEAANRAKSTFLANMSHELRTPMNAIIGYSEMLIEDAEDMEEAVFVSDLQKIRKAGKHLLSLINDVLDLSKIEAGKMQMVIEDFELKNLISDIQETVSGLIQKNRNAFEIDLASEPVVLTSDYMKIKQSLLNLLSNAAKFTEDGTVALKIATQNNKISFQVSDTGIGIPEESIAHLFDEFTQADDTTTRKYEGTGLGLAITQRFCKMLNGSVSAKSEKGKGSVFTIEIPISLKTSDGTADIKKEANTQDNPDRRPILIIEDDDNSANLIAKSLTKEGFEIIRATNGTQGIELARKHNPFAITLDVMMPGKDGWAILIELKNDKVLKSIPVIMVSVLDNLELGYALGAKDYLVKPVNKDALLSTIEECIPETNKDAGPVLIVDDEPDARDLLEKILTKQGWYSQTAINGKDALEKIAVQKPSLILLDIMMPVMDGFAFIKELRKIDKDSNIPVIVVTAQDLSPDELVNLTSKTDGILHKSAYKKDDLMEHIKELVINIKRRG